MLCVFSVYLFAKLFEHPSYMYEDIYVKIGYFRSQFVKFIKPDLVIELFPLKIIPLYVRYNKQDVAYDLCYGE